MSPGAPLAAALGLLRRDLLLLWRQRADALNPLLFALMVATLFPLALGPEAQMLSRVAGGIVWVTVVLASLLSLDAVFRGDADDGSLDQLATCGQPLAMLAGAKMLAHWIGTGLPLTLAGPLLAYMLGIDRAAISTLLLALLLGTPMLSMIGACCAALTVAMRRSGMLLALLVLPLTIPVLIFGAGAVDAASTGGDPSAPLLFLAAGLALALPLAPLGCAAAIRIGTA
jgi:heme exporter protein B